MALLFVGSGLFAGWPSGAANVVVGVAGLGYVVWLFRVAENAQLANSALGAIADGRSADARVLLDRIEARWHPSQIARVVELHRASLAFHDGDLETARAQLDAAVARPIGWLGRTMQAGHHATARALRALVAAASGDEATAEADLRAVRDDELAPGDALGRAELAHAMVLERRGANAELVAHLLATPTSLFDELSTRERALLRAVRRESRARASDAYRAPAPEERSGPSESALGDWLAQIAPAAAGHADGRLPDGSLRAPAAARVEENVVAALAAKRRPRTTTGSIKTLRYGLGAWVLLIVFFVAVWSFYSGEPVAPPRVAPPEPATNFWVWLGPGFLALMAVVLLATRRARHAVHALARANQLALRGELEAARALLEPLTKGRLVMLAAQAQLSLAKLAEREGDLPAARAHCDAGLARLSGGGGHVSASDVLLPELLAERAFVLAAQGSVEEAETELAALRRAFAAFPYASRAEFRVRLVARAQAGALDEAAAIAHGRAPELAIPGRDELLADAVIAATEPGEGGAAVRVRLREELRASGEAERWMVAVAPAALEALRG
jgi:hypothetical protein